MAIETAMVAKPELDEIATSAKDIDIFSGWLRRLENPDPVLRTEAGGKGLKLYDEVARDPHAASVLQTRYLAVTGKEWEVIPADPGIARARSSRGQPASVSQEEKIADFVRGALLGCNFDQARQEMLQGILYGFYPVEVMWRADGGSIVPARLMAKHPRRFSFTMERELRLLTPQNMIEGEQVPDRKFIVFTYGSSDNPYGSGLGQKLWWPVWFKKNGIKFWLVFLEKFGSPTPVGKYPPGTSDDSKVKLMDAIDALQSETGVTVPDTMAIDLLEATRAGNVTYESLCDYMDRQISKAVIGQTLTTEIKGEGSYAASQTHDEVRQEVVKADADILCECLNGTLVKWIVDYNFPGVSAYPKIWIRTEPDADLESLAARDRTLVKEIGLPVSKRYFYETYAISEPEEGEETVTPPQGPAPMFAERQGKPFDRQQEALEELADVSVRLGADAVAEIGKPILALVKNASSLEEIRDRLSGLYDGMNQGDLERVIGQALGVAALAGVAGAEKGKSVKRKA